GMVVVQDQSGGPRQKRSLQDLARLNDRAVERAAVDLGLVAEKPVPGVQVEGSCALLCVVALAAPQELLDEARLVQEIAAGQRRGWQPPSDLQGCPQDRRAGGT